MASKLCNADDIVRGPPHWVREREGGKEGRRKGGKEERKGEKKGDGLKS